MLVNNHKQASVAVTCCCWWCFLAEAPRSGAPDGGRRDDDVAASLLPPQTNIQSGMIVDGWTDGLTDIYIHTHVYVLMHLESIYADWGRLGSLMEPMRRVRTVSRALGATVEDLSVVRESVCRLLHVFMFLLLSRLIKRNKK